MLIILPEPIVTPEYDILSVNVDSYDSFIIRRLHNCFQLALHKLFDSSFQSHSQSVAVLANLDNGVESKWYLRNQRLRRYGVESKRYPSNLRVAGIPNSQPNSQPRRMRRTFSNDSRSDKQQGQCF